MIDYSVDLVLCIDSTGSMRPVIEMVKRNALNLYADIQEKLRQKNKQIDKLRVRVISFKDYLTDGDKAMMVSDFFMLPQEADLLSACVNDITAEGGGDPPEDGLEALAYAMKSAWTRHGMKKRHIIVVWSDSSTHDIGFGKESTYYPKGMPADFSELSLWWDDPQMGGVMDANAKRLIIFAPDKPSWNKISASWDQVIHVNTVAEGLSDVDYQMVLGTIGNSI